jgi:hypothetical protein
MSLDKFGEVYRHCLPVVRNKYPPAARGESERFGVT